MGRMRNGAGSMMAGWITGMLQRAKDWRTAHPSPTPQQPAQQGASYAAGSMLSERYASAMPALARYRKG